MQPHASGLLTRLVVAACLVLVISGCAGGGPTAQPASSMASSVPAPTDAAASLSVDPSATPTAGAGNGGAGGGGGGGGTGGGGTNTVVMEWSETVDRSGAGVQDLVHQEYKAIVHVTLSQTDIGSFDITGRADVTSSFTEDFTSSCSHYTDDASGSAVVDAQGGLQAGDTYEFYVNILGLSGSNATVRDDSPCGGPNNAETTEWPVAQALAQGSGLQTDPHHITGSSTTPRDGGEEKITWDFTLP